jgi:hypothetical protein
MEILQGCGNVGDAHEKLTSARASTLDFGVRCGDSKGTRLRQRSINQVPSQKIQHAGLYC